MPARRSQKRCELPDRPGDPARQSSSRLGPRARLQRRTLRRGGAGLPGGRVHALPAPRGTARRSGTGWSRAAACCPTGRSRAGSAATARLEPLARRSSVFRPELHGRSGRRCAHDRGGPDLRNRRPPADIAERMAFVRLRRRQLGVTGDLVTSSRTAAGPRQRFVACLGHTTSGSKLRPRPLHRPAAPRRHLGAPA